MGASSLEWCVSEVLRGDRGERSGYRMGLQEIPVLIALAILQIV